MKKLLVMRHAKSSWKDETLSDHDRPLNKRGLRDAPRMGAWVAQQQCLPDIVLSSTATRAHSTAELFVVGAKRELQIYREQQLYHARPRDYIEVLTSMLDGQSTVMVVSHNPGSEEWVYKLTNRYETMPTAAIALIEFEDPFQWQDLGSGPSGLLKQIWRPKEIFAGIDS